MHITQGDYDGKAVIISWVTSDEPGSNKVKFGLSEGKLDLTAEGTVHNYTFYNYKSGYIHQCLIEGLQVTMFSEFCKSKQAAPFSIQVRKQGALYLGYSLFS